MCARRLLLLGAFAVLVAACASPPHELLASTPDREPSARAGSDSGATTFSAGRNGGAAGVSVVVPAVPGGAAGAPVSGGGAGGTAVSGGGAGGTAVSGGAGGGTAVSGGAAGAAPLGPGGRGGATVVGASGAAGSAGAGSSLGGGSSLGCTDDRDCPFGALCVAGACEICEVPDACTAQCPVGFRTVRIACGRCACAPLSACADDGDCLAFRSTEDICHWGPDGSGVCGHWSCPNPTQDLIASLPDCPLPCRDCRCGPDGIWRCASECVPDCAF